MIQGKKLKVVNNFKYLGSNMQSSAIDFEIAVGWHGMHTSSPSQQLTLNLTGFLSNIQHFSRNNCESEVNHTKPQSETKTNEIFLVSFLWLASGSQLIREKCSIRVGLFKEYREISYFKFF